MMRSTPQAASNRFCVGTAFTTLGSIQAKEAESGKSEQRTTHGGYVREDAQVLDHPAGEELLDLLRQYPPNAVMEAYCSQGPGGMQWLPVKQRGGTFSRRWETREPRSPARCWTMACTRPVSSPVKETPGFSPFIEDRIYESACLPSCSIRAVGMSGFFPGLAYFVMSRPMKTRERHMADSIDVQVREAFLRCRCV
ncbi:MAG TPA: hypothetical protein PLR60_04450 [Syntrophorhabdaceae bacterium]|nr:hypothetical protein [Syntrophorhabdaceae bacterium]